jgi:RHH-type proline utilization regulon transcriptional repressor/proline dehydrogenase/delta 1-pyrroline-5-carboxylate dehydrogenase
MLVRIQPEDGLFEVLARIAAARISGCELVLAAPGGLDNEVTRFLHSTHGRKLPGDNRIESVSDEALIERLPELDRVRYAAPDRVPAPVYRAAAKSGFYIARDPVRMEGRLELLHYFINQSICDNYHRYGNLGERAL